VPHAANQAWPKQRWQSLPRHTAGVEWPASSKLDPLSSRSTTNRFRLLLLIAWSKCKLRNSVPRPSADQQPHDFCLFLLLRTRVALGVWGVKTEGGICHPPSGVAVSVMVRNTAIGKDCSMTKARSCPPPSSQTRPTISRLCTAVLRTAPSSLPRLNRVGRGAYKKRNLGVGKLNGTEASSTRQCVQSSPTDKPAAGRLVDQRPPMLPCPA
jgi:hypothetical protein